MNRRRWIIPALLGLLALLLAGYWGVTQQRGRAELETALRNKYQRAFYELVYHVQGVEVLLSKSLIGQDSKMDLSLFMNLWQQADIAQRELAQLPVPAAAAGRISKFLNQVSDFSGSLARQAAAGKPLSEEQWKTIKELYGRVSSLHEDLRAIETSIADGSMTMSELAGSRRRGLLKEAPRLADSNFAEISDKMKNMPVLIYDGPFSDHLAARKPRGLPAGTVSLEQARQSAFKFMQRTPGREYSFGEIRLDRGNIPVYRVEIVGRPLRRGERVLVGVTRQGGQVLWMINTRPLGDKKLSIRQALDRARSFLKERGFPDLEPNYYELQNNVLMINYVYKTSRGVLVYPDLLKVGVALDNGQVVAFEAKNYWQNHVAQRPVKPVLTLEQARQRLSPHLESVSSGRLAIIPVSPDKEVLTYEFKGQLGNDVYLVYINASTGAEEKILRLVRTGGGVLTI
ncbi:MAG: germination protein YpeB [Bacillota bacterium]|uniref:germination protein YpeB n=1 Tax=Desulfurispora thermophila TaxID=265470 RepID=UPI0003787AF7|nr:germination protein YpeB [Desulfurispora thermophila]